VIRAKTRQGGGERKRKNSGDSEWKKSKKQKAGGMERGESEKQQ
jgi:hypothetical protein